MTTRRLMGGLLVVLWLCAAGLTVTLIATWPPDLPWGLVRYVLAVLWVVVLTWMTRSFRRQGSWGEEHAR